MDTLGKLCAEGKASAEYLWQVPDDTQARLKIVGVLEQIGVRIGDGERGDLHVVGLRPQAAGVRP